MWWERLHWRKLFWKLQYYQTLSRINHCFCLAVHFGRTADFFFLINVRLLTQNCRARSRINCGIASVTQLGYTLHPIIFLCLRRILYTLAIEKVPEQTSKYRFSGFISFCTMNFIYAMYFSSGYMNSLSPESPFLLLPMFSSCGCLEWSGRERHALFCRVVVVKVIN